MMKHLNNEVAFELVMTSCRNYAFFKCSDLPFHLPSAPIPFFAVKIVGQGARAPGSRIIRIFIAKICCGGRELQMCIMQLFLSPSVLILGIL